MDCIDAEMSSTEFPYDNLFSELPLSSPSSTGEAVISDGDQGGRPRTHAIEMSNAMVRLLVVGSGYRAALTGEGRGVGVRYEDDVIERVVIPAVERALRDSAIEPPELF